MLLPGLLSLLFIAPRTTVPGVVPPTWFDPSTTITSLQPNLIEAFPRMPSNPRTEAETQSLGLSHPKGPTQKLVKVDVSTTPRLKRTSSTKGD